MSKNNINNIEPKQLALIAAVIAVELAEGKTASEVNILSSLVSSIGSSLSLMASQMQRIEDENK